MFGIGFGELLIIAVILIVAVGPESMPKLFKAVGRGMREFRRASRELRNTIGIDEMMRQEELKELRDLRSFAKDQTKDPFGINQALKAAQSGRAQPLAPDRHGMTEAELEREYPPEGIDLRVAGGEPDEATKPGAAGGEPG